jgi:hypothetical protein
MTPAHHLRYKIRRALRERFGPILGPVSAGSFLVVAVVGAVILAVTIVLSPLPEKLPGWQWAEAHVTVSPVDARAILLQALAAELAFTTVPLLYLTLAISSVRPLRDMAVRYVVLTRQVAIAIAVLWAGTAATAIAALTVPTSRGVLVSGLWAGFNLLIVIHLFVWFSMQLEHDVILDRITEQLYLGRIRAFKWSQRVPQLARNRLSVGATKRPGLPWARRRLWHHIAQADEAADHLGMMLEDAVQGQRPIDARAILDAFPQTANFFAWQFTPHLARCIRAASDGPGRYLIRLTLDRTFKVNSHDIDASNRWSPSIARSRMAYVAIELPRALNDYLIETNAPSAAPEYRQVLTWYFDNLPDRGYHDELEPYPAWSSRCEFLEYFLRTQRRIRPLDSDRRVLLIDIIRICRERLYEWDDSSTSQGFFIYLVLDSSSVLYEDRERQAAFQILEAVHEDIVRYTEVSGSLASIGHGWLTYMGELVANLLNDFDFWYEERHARPSRLAFPFIREYFEQPVPLMRVTPSWDAPTPDQWMRRQALVEEWTQNYLDAYVEWLERREESARGPVMKASR